MASAPRASPTVLVVERDGEELRRLLGLLETAHCDVRVAVDAFEACVVLQRFRPQLTLLNPEMPLAGAVVPGILTDPGAHLFALWNSGPFPPFARWHGVLRRPLDARGVAQVLSTVARHGASR